MILRRWNPKQTRNERWEVPDDWPVSANSTPSLKTRCACCGNWIRYRDKYLSMEIEDKDGLGYMVCGPCHFEEMKRAKECGTLTL